MPKQPKPKAQKLSKEQIAAQTKAVAEAARLRIVAKEKIFPALIGTRSMAHAQQVCEILKTVITNAQNHYWKDKTVKDLGLIEEMKDEEEVLDRDVYVALLEGLADISISDAHKLIEGMGGALSTYTLQIARKTKMDSISPDEIILDPEKAREMVNEITGKKK